MLARARMAGLQRIKRIDRGFVVVVVVGAGIRYITPLVLVCRKGEARCPTLFARSFAGAAVHWMRWNYERERGCGW